MGVETPSKAYQSMQQAWDLIDTVLGGTFAMRAAGETYLPRHKRETDDDFRRRLNLAVLRPYTRKAVDDMVSRPFSRPIQVEDDVPAELRPIYENADMQGNNLHNFAREVFRDAWIHGLSHILVDMPATGGKLNAAEERERGVRPYFVHVPARNLIAAFSQRINGREVLVHARILQTVVERDGFEEVHVPEIAVWEPGVITKYRKNSKSGKWEIFGESVRTTNLGFVPIATVYVDRSGFMAAAPPMEHVAHLNAAHWQSASDQANILAVSRFPMLSAIGIDSEEVEGGLSVGPNALLYSTRKDARFEYVEHTGAAIEAGRQSLKDLEADMAIASVDLMKRKSGDRTATESALEDRKELSVLEAAALSLQDALEFAFWIAATWLGLKDGGSIQVYTDFLKGVIAAGDLQTLDKARDRGDISRLAYVRELVRRGILPDSYDPDEDAELIEEEKGPYPFPAPGSGGDDQDADGETADDLNLGAGEGDRAA